jgi:AcrR family transcriptional regulator
MGRPKEHDEETRQQLLDAAEHIVDTEGPHAVTVRAVADRAGTSTRAVYALFGSKEGLLSGLATRGFQVLAQYVDQIPLTDDPFHDIIEATLRGFRRFAADRPSLNRLALQLVIPDLRVDPALPAIADATFGRLVERVERLQATGALGEHPPREIAAQVSALCEGLVNVERRGRLFGKRNPEDMWREAIAALLRGYAPAKAVHAKKTSKRRPRAQIRSK